jgi:hypothetical protein
LMGTTVISYGGQPCGDIAYNNTRRVRYVAVRGNSYSDSGRRYISVRSDDSYRPVRRVRYVAVRNDDVDYTPSRYVVVRRQPAYVDSGVRYVTVRNIAPRTRYVGVRYSDMDDADYDYAPHYVAVRRSPVVYESSRRYVSYDDDDDYVAPARYVAVRNVRNACACGVSSLNDVETTAPRHVVVKTDYIAGTQDVIVPRSSYDDSAYMTVPTANIAPASYVGYNDAAYWDDGGQRFVPAATYVESPTVRTVSYAPAYDDSDIDDEAIPDTADASYIAADDVGDACLSRVAVQAPMETSMQTVSYVPADDIDYDTSLSGSEPTYVVNEPLASAVNYEPIDDDSDMDTTYVANDVGASCSCPVAYQNPAALRTFEDDLGYHTVTAIPADNMTALNTVPVSYASTEDVSYAPAGETSLTDVNYVPADETNVAPVSYVPEESVGYADTADTDACNCAAPEAVVTEPAPIVDTSMAVVEPDDVDTSTEFVEPRPIAAETGYKDGLADGQAASLNGDENIPADSENFQTATNGYDDTLGDVNSNGVANRSSYLQGFSEGYNTELGP